MSFLKREEAGRYTGITKPPGGESSIFKDAPPASTPPSTPRRKNHMQSNIFAPVEPTIGTPRGGRRVDDSFNKLFGEVSVNGNGKGPDIPKTAQTPTLTPRVTKDHQKSNIFFVGDTKDAGSGSASPILNGKPKVINGDAHDSASSSGNSSGCVTPNGSNGSATPNGSVNGDAEPRTNGIKEVLNGVNNVNVNNGTPKRVPPGGYSTFRLGN